MKFCTLIDKDKAVKFAMKLLARAKSSIDMTMDLQGEVDHPLPKAYHDALLNLAKKRINIKRRTYGQKTLFNKMKTKFEGVQMSYGGPINHYQRMLIIDKKMGMFALNDCIFFTSFEPLIKSLLNYAKIK